MNRPRKFRRVCARCGKQFDAASDRVRYCGAACKQAAYRARKVRTTSSLSSTR